MPKSAVHTRYGGWAAGEWCGSSPDGRWLLHGTHLDFLLCLRELPDLGDLFAMRVHTRQLNRAFHFDLDLRLFRGIAKEVLHPGRAEGDGWMVKGVKGVKGGDLGGDGRQGPYRRQIASGGGWLWRDVLVYIRAEHAAHDFRKQVYKCARTYTRTYAVAGLPQFSSHLPLTLHLVHLDLDLRFHQNLAGPSSPRLRRVFFR